MAGKILTSESEHDAAHIEAENQFVSAGDVDFGVLHWHDDLQFIYVLEDMAASAGVSKTEVLRCFHKTLQTTPYSYVMEVRLSKATDLLAQTGLSVGEIASRTGFNQQSYFGKRFKEKTGMTPLEYRRKMRI